jgi:hypothetical protein
VTEIHEDGSPIKIVEWGTGLISSQIWFHSTKKYPFQGQQWGMWVIYFTDMELGLEWCAVTSEGRVSQVHGQHTLLSFFLSFLQWMRHFHSLLRENPSS